MPEAKKHLKNIIPYPIEEELDWDLKLDFNENLIGPSKKVLKAIRNIDPKNIKFYPVYEKLIKAIAEYNNVNTENVIPVNGTDEGYRYIFDAYCGFGDNVLTVTPAFSMPKIYAAIAAVGQMDNGDPEMSEFCEELLDSLSEERNRRKKK